MPLSFMSCGVHGYVQGMGRPNVLGHEIDGFCSAASDKEQIQHIIGADRQGANRAFGAVLAELVEEIVVAEVLDGLRDAVDAHEEN